MGYHSLFPWLQDHLIFHALVSITVVAILFKLRRSRYSNLHLPPSPWKLPILGNLHQVGLLPHHNLQSLARKHGSLMLLHFGQAPTLIVSSADAAKEIYQTHDINFSNRPNLKVGEKLFYSSMGVAFSPYGENWKHGRKMVVSELLSVPRMEYFKTVRKEEVHLMVETIRQISVSSSPLVNLCEILTSLSVGLICRVALGKKYRGDGADGNFVKTLREVTYLVGVFNVGDFIPWLAWVNHFNGINSMYTKTFKKLDSLLETVIEEHIHGAGNERVQDFVDTLLQIAKDGSINGVPFTRYNVKAQLVDIFLAGSETIAATLVWAMTELMQNSEILKKVQIETREICNGKQDISEDDLEQMHYMQMVIKETLRLHPPSPLLLPRESIQQRKILGYDIPAQTRVITNAWAIGRDPLLWDNPEKFLPERFANNSSNYKAVDFEFIPFGAGRRACVGMGYSKLNMEFALANLLYHFDWSFPDGTTAENLDVTEGFGAAAYKKLPLLLVPTLRSY